jgi:methyltransferase (TIGR00027 family)
MKEGKASRTADLTAGVRAVESLLRPENERVCYDPYAVAFLGGIYGLIFKSRPLIPTRLLLKIIDSYAERIHHSGLGNIPVRTRFIDDYLQTCIDDGIEQLVILGAGYDSRAYRFELKGEVTVFEVDHPETQRIKKEKVKKIIGFLPEHVIYVPIDFNKEKLDEKLSEYGHQNSMKTLFIWEGVTYYITAEAVDETLAFVVQNSGDGSSIIFDYAYKSMIDGRLKEAEKYRRYLEKKGEPYIFGIEEGAIEEFLVTRGFGQVKDMNAESLENTYYKGTNRKAATIQGIVHATVKERE